MKKAIPYFIIIALVLILIGMQNRIKRTSAKVVTIHDTVSVIKHDTITDTLFFKENEYIVRTDSVFFNDTTVIYRYYPKYVFSNYNGLDITSKPKNDMRVEFDFGVKGRKPQFIAKFVYNF